MTITYTAQVATSSLGCFLKLLLRWKGSIYKLLWKEFLIFAGAYYVLNFIYRFGLSTSQKLTFAKISKHCEEYSGLIPLSFILGFYVSIVITRWWDMFTMIPWPDRMSIYITAAIQGHTERARLMRRTIMRYLCLSYVITMSSICSGVKKRFPKFTHMTDAGFMLPNEQKIIEGILTPHNKYFVPLVWATALVTRARKEKLILDDFAVKTLMDEIVQFRGKLAGLLNFDWISVPLVYTQVVTLAVHMFFLACLMGRQLLENNEHANIYVPMFTFLQFFFYMGWLKVAESLVNPFGDDDDDFDINWLIDRNLQVAYLIVDEMHEEHPELLKDQYWDEVFFELPYTAATAQHKDDAPFLGSVMHMNIPEAEQEFVTLASVVEEDAVTAGDSNATNIPQGQNKLLLKLGIGRSLSKSSERKHNNWLPKNRKYSSHLSSQQSIRQGSFESGTTKPPDSPVSPCGRPKYANGRNHIHSSAEEIFQMTDIDSIASGSKNQLVGQPPSSSVQSVNPIAPVLTGLQASPVPVPVYMDNIPRTRSSNSFAIGRKNAQGGSIPGSMTSIRTNPAATRSSSITSDQSRPQWFDSDTFSGVEFEHSQSVPSGSGSRGHYSQSQATTLASNTGSLPRGLDKTSSATLNSAQAVDKTPRTEWSDGDPLGEEFQYSQSVSGGSGSQDLREDIQPRTTAPVISTGKLGKKLNKTSITALNSGKAVDKTSRAQWFDSDPLSGEEFEYLQSVPGGSGSQDLREDTQRQPTSPVISNENLEREFDKTSRAALNNGQAVSKAPTTSLNCGQADERASLIRTDSSEGYQNIGLKQTLIKYQKDNENS